MTFSKWAAAEGGATQVEFLHQAEPIQDYKGCISPRGFHELWGNSKSSPPLSPGEPSRVLRWMFHHSLGLMWWTLQWSCGSFPKWTQWKLNGQNITAAWRQMTGLKVCGGNSERVSVRVCDCTDVCLHVCRCDYGGPWSFTRVTFKGFTTFTNPLGGIVAKLSQI